MSRVSDLLRYAYCDLYPNYYILNSYHVLAFANDNTKNIKNMNKQLKNQSIQDYSAVHINWL